MNLVRRLLVVPAFPLLMFFSQLALAANWPPISPDELKMTSIKEQPGASAVILLREETDDDMNNMHHVYERIKILTDAGREYADVQLPYRRSLFHLEAISGRTVHSDGSVVEFQGKPFDKTVMKAGGVRINVKSFSLPDVQVGSIIDYRYSLRYDDNRVVPPEWDVQRELFQRKAYFKFIPFQNHGSVEIQLAHGQIARQAAWLPIIGNGAQPQLHTIPSRGNSTVHDVTAWVDLNLNDVPALVEEPFMAPASLVRWRVYFYYQEALNSDEYWKAQSKFWHKDVDSFLGKDGGVADAVRQIITPSDVPEQKVRKIYSYVAALENQNYIPERSAQEQKILDLKINKGASDVLAHHSGSHDELTRLFVAMVRAAGVPAYVMTVPDRSEHMFIKQWMSTEQLDAEIAIVELDGKDIFLDPGTKFCPYGVLDWRYTGVAGIRQTAKGTDFAETPTPKYADSVSTRMANVSLDEHGVLSGTITLVFKGGAAMHQRQLAGKTDENGRRKLLEDGLSDSEGHHFATGLKDILPGNAEVKLLNSPAWDKTEEPLMATFHVSCPFAVAAGKRLMLAQHLFQVNERARFSAADRKNAVYFHTPWQEADEVHLKLPPGMEVESLAPDDTIKLPYALYQVRQKMEGSDKIFSRRDFIMGQALFTVPEYKDVKGFFDKVNSDDQQPALIKLATNVATGN